MDNKHIEEMAKCCTYYHNGECFVCSNHPTDCDLMCEMYGVFANLERASYRKASDVIDEFAERLKLTAFEIDMYESSFLAIEAADIDRIANEMKGEGK